MQIHVGKNATPQKNMQTSYSRQNKCANIWQINEVYDKDEQDGEEGGGVWKMSLPRTSSMALLAG